MNILPAKASALRASTVAFVVGLSAFAATSCTTGSSPSITSALSSAAESAETMQAKSTSENAMPSGMTAAVSPEALALAGKDESSALQALKGTAKPTEGAGGQAEATTAAQGANATQQAAAQPAQKTSLFGSSTEAKPEGSVEVASAATAAAPARKSLFGNSMRGEGAPAPQKAASPAAPAEPADAGAGAKANAISEAATTSGNNQATRAQPNKDSGLLLRLFGNNQAKPDAGRQVAIIQPKSQPQLRAGETQVQTASAALPSAASFAGKTEHLSSLPGVRPNAGIQIMQRDSLYDDDDMDYAPAPVILASAAGLARLAPNGLKVQRENVQVACLKPQLVATLKMIERRFGKAVIVTSGYRSPPYNRLVNGAKASLHMSCAAADIQVPGVSKWQLANFARSMPGRGGVGTYCHTESVHVDIGPTRDWNWRCSRGRA